MLIPADVATDKNAAFLKYNFQHILTTNSIIY